MIFLFWIGNALAGAPTAVETRRVEGVIGGEFVIQKEDGKGPSLYASDGSGVSFFCDSGTLVGYRRKSMEKYAELAAQMAEVTTPGASFNFDPAKRSFVGSQATGYCNMSGSVRDGKSFVTVVHNRECFGSAGCNTESVTLGLEGPQLTLLLEALRWGAAKEK